MKEALISLATFDYVGLLLATVPRVR